MKNNRGIVGIKRGNIAFFRYIHALFSTPRIFLERIVLSVRSGDYIL